MTRENWPRTRGESESYQKRWKRAVKLLGAHGYTPLASRTIANFLCDLANADEQKKLGMLSVFTKIVREP